MDKYLINNTNITKEIFICKLPLFAHSIIVIRNCGKMYKLLI